MKKIITCMMICLMALSFTVTALADDVSPMGTDGDVTICGPSPHPSLPEE